MRSCQRQLQLQLPQLQCLLHCQPTLLSQCASFSCVLYPSFNKALSLSLSLSHTHTHTHGEGGGGGLDSFELNVCTVYLYHSWVMGPYCGSSSDSIFLFLFHDNSELKKEKCGDIARQYTSLNLLNVVLILVVRDPLVWRRHFSTFMKEQKHGSLCGSVAIGHLWLYHHILSSQRLFNQD